MGGMGGGGITSWLAFLTADENTQLVVTIHLFTINNGGLIFRDAPDSGFHYPPDPVGYRIGRIVTNYPAG